MRNPWKLLLLRNFSRSQHTIQSSFSHFMVNPSREISTFPQFTFITQNYGLLNSNNYSFPLHLKSCSFTSEVAVETNEVEKHVVLIDLFKKNESLDAVKKEMELNKVQISHELILNVLKGLENDVRVAHRVFGWVLNEENEKLSSKSYNLMLVNYGSNGLNKEFWELFEVMKKKGYGMSKWVYDKVLKNFENNYLSSDAMMLRKVFASGSVDNYLDEKVDAKVAKIIRSEVWGENVEGALKGLNVRFSADLVKVALDRIGEEPMKAMIFFRWLEESGLCKHDYVTYNAMLRVLAREDCIDKFWKVADEMKSAGYWISIETYAKAFRRFSKRRMLKDMVDLYEFAMNGVHMPTIYDCILLLRKLVGGKELDVELFSRVVKIFTDPKGKRTNNILDAVLKALTGAGRVGDYNKILKVMREVEFVPNSTLQSKIAFKLSSLNKTDEAKEFIENLAVSESTPDSKTWASLIEGHCVAGNLDEASETLKKMVEKEGASSAGSAVEVLVNVFCRKNQAIDACKLLSDMVTEKELKPWHSTYKTLITGLLVQGGFTEALSLLSLMKSQGFPPYLDPFVEYISKTGTADDAISFLKEMTINRFPSTSVVLRVFEAFFKVKRHNEAQDLLSKCPGYIRNHTDVLNLFYTMKSGNAALATSVAA